MLTSTNTNLITNILLTVRQCMAGNGSPYWGTNARDGLGWLDAPAEYNNTDQYNNTANTITHIHTIIQASSKIQENTITQTNTITQANTIIHIYWTLCLLHCDRRLCLYLDFIFSFWRALSCQQTPFQALNPTRKITKEGEDELLSKKSGDGWVTE